jgi:phosphoglycerate dehydrogenase-like enzyme
MTSPADDRPVVVLKPAPQRARIIFSPAAMDRLRSAYRVVDLEDDPSDEAFEAVLPEAFAIIGQPDLPAERLARAPRLRIVLNVEGNFYPNVDYERCFERGIHVVACGPAYSQAVAEHSVGLAIDLARGISREDRAFREGRERYVSGANDDAILLRGASMGLLGYGNIGRALVPLLAAFRPRVVRAYDPWLPERILRDGGMEPAGLDEILGESTFLFVLATVTAESTHLLDADRLDLIPRGARLVLVSRAAVVDYDALVPRVAAGRFLVASDVWPEEPMPLDHEVRSLEGFVLSAHRAGGIPQAFLEIGEMVLDDLAQVARGLPPARMQPAARELVGRYRNRPVTADTDPGRA